MNPVFVADIGNSSVKMARFLKGKPGALRRFPHAGRLSRALAEICRWLRARGAAEVVLGSVNRTVERALTKALHRTGLAVRPLTRPPRLSMKVEVNRRTLGIDRLANVVAARAFYREKNLIVVDSGTALTVNVIEGNIFRGGWIAPGLGTLFTSLSASTDRLPALSPTARAPRLGRETRTAIDAGTRIFFEGGLEALVARVEKLRRRKFMVIVTGGGSAGIRNLGRRCRRDPGLTLRGLFLLSGRKK